MAHQKQRQTLISTLRRNILKPASKLLLAYCPAMHAEMMSVQLMKTLPRYLLYVATFLILCVTMWTLFPVSSDREAVTIAMSSNMMIKAVYKYAYENSDGTVDLVLTVPKGGEALLRLNSLALNTTMDESEHIGTTESPETTSPKSVPVRSNYPIGLDADFVINSVNICPDGQEVDYLIVVHSATAYFARRRTIRETYAGKGVFGHITQKLVFLLGTTTDPVVTKFIQEEAFLYRDVVQGQFFDSYHNLTHKGVLGYRWITQYCPQAKLIVKIDDDVFINPFKLVKEFLPKYVNKSRHIACHLRPAGTSPIVRGKGKWQVHEDEFRGQNHFPFDYCNGYFVIITPDLIRPMLNAARLNPFFWIDDVYLFGILPATVGSVTFVNIKKSLTLAYKTGKRCFDDNRAGCWLVAASPFKQEDAEKLWYTVLSNLTDTVKKELNVFGLSKYS